MLGGVDHDIHNIYHDLPRASSVKSLGQRRFSALNSFITQASINQKYFLLWPHWNYITLPRPYTMADEAPSTYQTPSSINGSLEVKNEDPRNRARK